MTGLLLATLLAGPAAASGQPLTSRTPNLTGPWVPPPGTTHFTFLHRFERIGEGSTKLVNYPTFRLETGLPAGFALAASYTSNSDLRLGTADEWELALREGLALGGVDLAGTVAWNTAAESVDGEIAARWSRGPVSLHGVARGLSAAYGADAAAAAVGGGIEWRPVPRLALVADVVRVVTTDSLPVAWSAGIHLVVPGSPHTLGFVVSNVGVTTLQGASRGLEDAEGKTDLRYGFAFTIPLGSWSRWARVFRPSGDGEGAGADVTIRDFAFGPAEVVVPAGETVTWMNADSVVHTVVSDDGAFDSGPIQPGEGYARRFDVPGTYAYHCLPHPFMRGTVRVVTADGGAGRTAAPAGSRPSPNP